MPSPARSVVLGLLGVMAVLVAMPMPRLSALEPTTPVASYGRQSWVMENGLPQNTVQALAQTKDGFVWLGTEVGLVRFDGNSFTVFDHNSSPALPGNDVRCLLATSDGALWIGTSEGLAQWMDGLVTAFTTKDGLPGDGIRALGQAPDGSLLATTDAGNAQLRGAKFVKVDLADLSLEAQTYQLRMVMRAFVPSFSTGGFPRIKSSTRK